MSLIPKVFRSPGGPHSCHRDLCVHQWSSRLLLCYQKQSILSSACLGCPASRYRSRAFAHQNKMMRQACLCPYNKSVCERRGGGNIERRMRVDKGRDEGGWESSRDTGFDVRWHTANSALFADPLLQPNKQHSVNNSVAAERREAASS